MDLTEKTLSSEKIFDGRILHVRRDTVELPDGGTGFREVVDHPGGVCVLALDDENRALLVSQYRYPYEKVLREIPAGKLEYGEDPTQAAIRELKEETGASSGDFRPLGELYPSPGYCGEIIRMYLARDLTFGEAHPDEDEFLNLERVPFDELVEQVLSGEIKDAKTIAAVLKGKLLLQM
ncbi:MAG: NUDIX hydrolase [Oscillospiraceae bacterium]|nr:NUDIX hydrolase [Oscillospiraceae bacterium]